MSSGKLELDHDTSTQSLGECTISLLPPESVQAPSSLKAALQTAQLQALGLKKQPQLLALYTADPHEAPCTGWPVT